MQDILQDIRVIRIMSNCHESQPEGSEYAWVEFKGLDQISQVALEAHQIHAETMGTAWSHCEHVLLKSGVTVCY